MLRIAVCLFFLAYPTLLLANSSGKKLRTEIERGTVYAMGIEGTKSAEVALNAGYRVLFLSGSWVTKVVHNKPDIGFYTAGDATDISEQIIRKSPGAILLVDVDGGFGKLSDTSNSKDNIKTAVQAAVRLEEIGVAGIVIDDQNPLSRKAEVDPGKEIIAKKSMEQMIKAIRNAVSPEFVIIGRTAAEQNTAALERAEMLKSAGSDLVIVEAINDSKQELRKLQSKNNMQLTTIQLDKGQQNPWTRIDHENMGIKVVLLANALRKRWPANPQELDRYTMNLKLDLQGCRLGY